VRRGADRAMLASMATIRKEIHTTASLDAAWDAVRDIGALHTRLVPGFVTATKVEGTTRIVTFANGSTAREPIVTIDDAEHRLVWTSEGGKATHYNSSAQVVADSAGTRVIWLTDLLPDSLAPAIDAAMTAGAKAMKTALDKL
jgi:hypothetical protein